MIISANKGSQRHLQFLDNIDEAANYTREHKTNEIIFCIGSISFNTVSQVIQQLPPQLIFKFHATGSGSIVGSISKNSIGEVLAL